MRVIVRLEKTSQALLFKDVKNTYQKGDFYCIYTDNTVRKIPIQTIFDIEEEY